MYIYINILKAESVSMENIFKIYGKLRKFQYNALQLCLLFLPIIECLIKKFI
jgi:hypothetical protein